MQCISLRFVVFHLFSCVKGGAKKRFRLYRIYSKVVPLTFFISLDHWVTGSRDGLLGHVMGHWVTGSWVTYAMGQMGHGSRISDPWSTLMCIQTPI